MLQTRLRSSPAHPSQTHDWPVPSGTGRGTARSPESDKTPPYTCGRSVTEAQSLPVVSHIADMCKACKKNSHYMNMCRQSKNKGFRL